MSSLKMDHKQLNAEVRKHDKEGIRQNVDEDGRSKLEDTGGSGKIQNNRWLKQSKRRQIQDG